MTYLEFAQLTPVLYGQITVNDKSKIGSFSPAWSRYSNKLEYAYHTETGRKGTRGFTLKRAFYLLVNNNLSINPFEALKENYV